MESQERVNVASKPTGFYGDPSRIFSVVQMQFRMVFRGRTVTL